MRTFKEDYQQGTAQELNIKPILESHFGPLTKTPTHFPMDYKGKTAFLEIKTRTNASTTYPTTMIPYSKIQFAKASKLNTFFIFVFTDGIYYIKYDQSFDTFEKSTFQRSARLDHNDRPQLYLYIPTPLLLKMDDPIPKESV